MPAGVIPIRGARQGTYVLLEAALPGEAGHTIGVFLVDPETGRGWLRMKPRFDDIAGPEDAEVLEALEPDMRECIAGQGGERYLEWLEDRCSNVLRIGERQAVAVDAFSRVADRLFEEHVESIPVERFHTHAPLYSLRAAAGSLGEEMPVEAEDWVRTPKGMRLSTDHFVAHVVGRSMEPRIPDGSLNLFRLRPVGSRQGKIVLVERFGVLQETARYTVKRYTSSKVQDPDGTWRHGRIRLEPLNPEFDAWDVGPEDFAVVAEWVCVIE
jgi:SOS-response transcriptional repressor LexA